MKNMKNLFRILTCIALAATSLRAQTNGNKAATSGLPPLIDRELIFGNPEIVNPELSPDGRFLAFEKPWKNTRYRATALRCIDGPCLGLN